VPADRSPYPAGAELAPLPGAVLEVTQAHWSSPIELDLAVAFDVRGCGLKCFEQTEYRASARPHGGLDCLGLYKKQKGCDGFVAGAGLQVARIYPCRVIRRRSRSYLARHKSTRPAS
jgi:hypothetical protein